MATVILAGGSSKRMGRDKASLEIGGSTLIQSLVTRFADKFGGVIVVVGTGDQPAVDGALMAYDVYHNAGPLGGLHAGLLATQDEVNFVLACDMPLASVELASYIVSLAPGYDAVVPMLARGPEPLHAAYAKSCLGVIESAIADGNLKMADALKSLNVFYVTEDKLRDHDPELHSFVNVNTHEDYLEATQLLQALSRGLGLDEERY